MTLSLEEVTTMLEIIECVAVGVAVAGGTASVQTAVKHWAKNQLSK